MNNKIIIGLVLIVIIIIGVYMFMRYQTPNNLSTTPSAAPTTSQTEPIPPNTVIIKNFAFNPTPLSVKSGDIVTWVNQDSVTHSVKSTEFASPNLQPGDKFQFKYSKGGVYNYNCGIHPSMTGSIVVQ